MNIQRVKWRVREQVHEFTSRSRSRRRRSYERRTVRQPGRDGREQHYLLKTVLELTHFQAEFFDLQRLLLFNEINRMFDRISCSFLSPESRVPFVRYPF